MIPGLDLDWFDLDEHPQQEATMSFNGGISSTWQNLNSNQSNSNFNANGLPNAPANGVSEAEGEGRSNENSLAQ